MPATLPFPSEIPEGNSQRRVAFAMQAIHARNRGGRPAKPDPLGDGDGTEFLPDA